jgi:transcriptional regulator with XRE-family HTH domain
MKKDRVKNSRARANGHSTLGGLIRLVRQQNDWTLRQMSDKVGIPLSTLAKVEADKLSLTYDKLQQFTSRLGLTMTEFLAQGEAAPQGSEAPVVTARRSLATRAHGIAEFGQPVRHQGEEFIYVLEGSIEVHLQFYTAITLIAGQGIYLDSTMGHAYVAKDCDSASRRCRIARNEPGNGKPCRARAA